MKKRYLLPAILACACLAVVPLPVQAYVGPGAGISLLGALWALVAVIGSALLYVVLWPLRRLRRRRGVRGRMPAARGVDPDSRDPEAESGAGRN